MKKKICVYFLKTTHFSKISLPACKTFLMKQMIQLKLTILLSQNSVACEWNEKITYKFNQIKPPVYFKAKYICQQFKRWNDYRNITIDALHLSSRNDHLFAICFWYLLKLHIFFISILACHWIEHSRMIYLLCMNPSHFAFYQLRLIII